MHSSEHTPAPIHHSKTLIGFLLSFVVAVLLALLSVSFAAIAQERTASGSVSVSASLATSVSLPLFRTVADAETHTTAQRQAASKLASKHFTHFSVLEVHQTAFRQAAREKSAFRCEILLGTKAQKPVIVRLEPFSVFAPNARIVAKTATGDEIITLEEEFTTFRGSIDNDPQSSVFCSMSKQGVMMTIQTRGVVWSIEPLASTDDETLSHNAQNQMDSDEEHLHIAYSTLDTKQPRQFICGASEFDDNEHHEHSQENQSIQNNDKSSTEAHSSRVCEMGIDIDFATFQSLGSKQSQAAQYAAALIAGVSQIFERDVQTRLQVSHVQVWTTPDPYSSSSTMGAVLNTFRSTWNANYSSVNRDLAHLFTVRGLGGGVAYLNTLCNPSMGYGLSANLRGSFPIDPAWTTIVVAHEIGHNFGSYHTHSCRWSGGAIDRCAPAEDGACFSGTVQSRGTIMSYCHLWPGGTSNIDMNFHPTCASLMQSRAAAASCLSATNGGGVEVSSILGFTPQIAGQGAQIVISGSGFTGTTAVRFGGVNAHSFTVNNATQITAVVGAGASGTIDVVRGSGTLTSSSPFTFTTDVTPSTGTLSFPSTRLNRTTTLTAQFRNNDTRSVQYNGISMGGAHSSDFRVIASSLAQGGMLGAGQMHTVTIEYRPSGTNTRTAVLSALYQGKPTAQMNLIGLVDISPMLEVSTSRISTPVADVGDNSAPVMYELRGELLSEAIIVTATGDVEIALSSTASARWAKRLDIPNASNIVTVQLWVRTNATREGVLQGTVMHWSNTSNARLEVSGASSVSFINAPQTLDFGTLSLGQVGVASYDVSATNISRPFTIQAPSGFQLALDDNGPWAAQLTIAARNRLARGKIFVRTQAATSGTITASINHSAGILSQQMRVVMNVQQAFVRFDGQTMRQGALQLGYVPNRQTTFANYWINAVNVASTLEVSSADGLLVSVNEQDWSSSLSIPAQNGNIRQQVFVRYSPRFSGLLLGTIAHRSGSRTTHLSVQASTKQPTFGVSTCILDYGALQRQTTATMTFRMDAEGFSDDIHIQFPRGVEARLNETQDWATNFVITPLRGQASLECSIRLTSEFPVAEAVRRVISLSTTEQAVRYTDSVNVIANMVYPPAVVVITPPTPTPTDSGNTSGNTSGNGSGTSIGSPTGTNQITSVRSRTLGERMNARVQATSSPNPFREIVTLRWKQETHGAAEVVIYSSNGAVVRVLRQGIHSAGSECFINWDGRDDNGANLSSGAYFGQILVNGIPSGQVTALMLQH
ncbi:MAG: hypothetical protein EAZ92_14725 [Candidatus Kapaibacterium sp.]|nr:MAG: hypothetical protein EAZ92_14725 [Candidatus Kapabacteria bacterium]